MAKKSPGIATPNRSDSGRERESTYQEKLEVSSVIAKDGSLNASCKSSEVAGVV